MDLNRLRKLAGLKKVLKEDWADDSARHDQIIHTLEKRVPDKTEQSKVLSAIEALEALGKGRSDILAWMSAYTAMRSGFGSDAMTVINKTIELFPNLIGEENGKYYWIPHEEVQATPGSTDRPPLDDGPLDPRFHNVFSLMRECWSHATSMETFTAASLWRFLRARAGELGITPAQGEVEGVVGSFFMNEKHSFEVVEDNGDWQSNVYRVKDTERRKPRGTMTRGDYSDMFKDIANNAAKANLGPED